MPLPTARISFVASTISYLLSGATSTASKRPCSGVGCGVVDVGRAGWSSGRTPRKCSRRVRTRSNRACATPAPATGTGARKVGFDVPSNCAGMACKQLARRTGHHLSPRIRIFFLFSGYGAERRIPRQDISRHGTCSLVCTRLAIPSLSLLVDVCLGWRIGRLEKGTPLHLPSDDRYAP